MRSQIKLDIRPNNQLILTFGSWRKPENLAYKSAYLTNNETQQSRNFDANIKTSKNLAAIERAKNLYRQEIRVKPSKAHLDIIQKSQRSKKAPFSRLHKPKNFTKASGQKLRESGAAVDIACNSQPRFCHEVTLTLPGNTKEAFRALAAQSHYIVNRLFQPIRRKYGEMCLWFFVWEYQSRGALHMHICIYHPDESEGLWISAQLVDQWHKILQDVGEMVNTDMFLSRHGDRCTIRSNHQHHTAPINKAVGAYFSKYAGKEESKNNWYCRLYPISRFWGSSMSVKEIVKEFSLTYNIDLFREQEAQSKFESIIENILSKLNIVSSSSYDFDIQLSGKARRNKAKNGAIYIVSEDGQNVASGTRYTFYVSPEDFHKAIELTTIEMGHF